MRERVAAAEECNRPQGMTLEAQEKWEAREAEKARTRERATGEQMPQRAASSRVAAAAGSQARRETFAERAASVDPEAAPGRADPREHLSREQLAAVNQQADRIHEEVRESGTRAAIARRIAERVVDGTDVLSAAVAVLQAVKIQPGTVVPLGLLEETNRGEVTVEGEVVELWDASSPAIAQVGLIADETGRTKFTSWERSHQPPVIDGEQVRFRGAQKNWYQGRCSIALTGRSEVVRLDKV